MPTQIAQVRFSYRLGPFGLPYEDGQGPGAAALGRIRSNAAVHGM
jgi:hypothetical protein